MPGAAHPPAKETALLQTMCSVCGEQGGRLHSLTLNSLPALFVQVSVGCWDFPGMTKSTFSYVSTGCLHAPQHFSKIVKLWDEHMKVTMGSLGALLGLFVMR